MKPGKQVALAKIHGKPIVCLPGNPGSAFAVFMLLVSPLMRTMQGRNRIMPAVQYGRLGADSALNETRDEFLRVRCEFAADGTAALTPYRHQGSGVVSALQWASGLARIPAKTRVKAGGMVAYYDARHWLA